MKRLFGAGLVVLVGVGTVGAAYFIASAGSEEEAVQNAETATATTDASATPPPLTPGVTATAPAGLPPSEEGYVWFVTPSNDFGLPLYAVQVPTSFARNPTGPYYGNPENFIPSTVDASERYASRLVIRVTPADAVAQQAFRFELPCQEGTICGTLPGGEMVPASGTWSLFAFTCPKQDTGYCAADEEKKSITCTPGDPSSPFPTFDGLVAEIRIGDYFHSIIIFQPGAIEDAEATFQQAVDTFTLR